MSWLAKMKKTGILFAGCFSKQNKLDLLKIIKQSLQKLKMLGIV